MKRFFVSAAALIIAAAATLAIPNGFRLVIDKGFNQSGGDVSRWFEYLLGVVSIENLRHQFMNLNNARES